MKTGCKREFLHSYFFECLLKKDIVTVTPMQQIALGYDETAALLPFKGLAEALRLAYAGDCNVPPRHHHSIKAPGEPEATLLLMPSWKFEGERSYLGLKIVNVYPGNSKRNIPGLTSSYLLFDGMTGRPLATLDGNAITSRRTAAVSVLGATFLARPDSSRLLILGTGRVGSLLPEAFCSFFPISQIRIWDRDADKAAEMVARLQVDGIDAAVADDLEAEARQADIITCATLSTAALITGEWLQPGVHVDLIGAFTPKMRETDDEAVAACRVYVDVNEAFHEAGDLVQAMANGAFSEEDCQGTLSDLCRGVATGRTNPNEKTMFKAVGSAISDLAAAAMVYEDANSN